MIVAKTIRLASLGALTLVLTACSGSSDDLQSGQWVNTPSADVYCLVDSASHGFFSIECDWSTKTDPGTHTTDERYAVGEDLLIKEVWLDTERGEVYCLESALAYGSVSHDCDWSTLKEKDPSGLDFQDHNS